MRLYICEKPSQGRDLAGVLGATRRGDGFLTGSGVTVTWAVGHLLETGTTEEIFEHPIHPYTRSLLSAIPLPNPVVEKRRVAETYDYATSGIDYSKGTSHLVSGSHYVKCTDEEFAKWCK